MSEQVQVEHKSCLDKIEQDLMGVFDRAVRGANNGSIGAEARASNALSAAETAKALIELRKQREFEALPTEMKKQLKLPSMKSAAS